MRSAVLDLVFSNLRTVGATPFIQSHTSARLFPKFNSVQENYQLSYPVITVFKVPELLYKLETKFLAHLGFANAHLLRFQKASFLNLSFIRAVLSCSLNFLFLEFSGSLSIVQLSRFCFVVVLATAYLDYHIFHRLSTTFLFFFAVVCHFLSEPVVSRDSLFRLSHANRIVKYLFLISFLISTQFDNNM